MKKVLVLTGRVFWVILLTLFTQVGGMVYLLSKFILKSLKLNWWKRQLAFLLLYLVVTFFIVPPLARIFGRAPLPMSGSIRPVNLMTCMLNRHYVKTGMIHSLKGISLKMKSIFPEVYVAYLDANFPFMDGFPLLPHWSHNDGRKIDLAFYYRNQKSMDFVHEKPSWIGYGVFENPRGNEVDTGEMCEKNGYWQYELLGMLPHRYDMEVEPTRTTALIELLAKEPEVEKIFIEPHLKDRWGLALVSKIRFHGCHAVSHADHIHAQFNFPNTDF